VNAQLNPLPSNKALITNFPPHNNSHTTNRYNDFLQDARFIDLTHPIEVDMPLSEEYYTKPLMLSGKSDRNVDGFIAHGQAFDYHKHGFVTTSYV
jgi:hypothetical protein